MGEIVTGVDGSEASKRALRWALDEARLRDDSLVVVNAYQRTVVRAPHASIDPYVRAETMRAATASARRTQEEQDERDRHRAERIVHEALREAGSDGRSVVVKPLVMARDAAKTLVDVSEHAELLVVGSRGRGGVTGLLLGSVSQHCVHHARCPVVVIR